MADRPILFSAPMVLALLAGRKTQTRRLIKVEAERPIMDFVKVGTNKDTGRAIYEMKDAAGKNVAIAAGKYFVTEHYSPPIAVGDRLWVKETWKPHSIYADIKPSLVPESKVFYRADDTYAPSNTKWWPSLYIPRWASRITLLVDDVRVERLQAITDEDAIAEGVVKTKVPFEYDVGDIEKDWYSVPGLNDPGTGISASDMFAQLWELTHGDGAWDSKPWIVAYTFRVVLENIDRIGRAA